MIICVSANPAIDRRLRVKNIEIGAVNRAAAVRSFAGGKAAHVAMAAHALGEEVVWVGFLGGASGDEVERQLTELNIHVVAIRTVAQTRTNDEIIDENGNITEILEPGGAVTGGELAEMFKVCQMQMAADAGFHMVLSGSLPPGVPDDFYSRMIVMAREYGGNVILDTSGEALLAGVKAGPDLIKPNREETEKAVGINVGDAESAFEAARRLRELGARNVAISMGADGIFWTDGKDSYLAEPPKVEVFSTVGCGDAAVAGFAVAAQRNLGKDESIRLAVACGAANCTAKLPGQVRSADAARLSPQIKVKHLSSVAVPSVTTDDVESETVEGVSK